MSDYWSSPDAQSAIARLLFDQKMEGYGLQRRDLSSLPPSSGQYASTYTGSPREQIARLLMGDQVEGSPRSNFVGGLLGTTGLGGGFGLADLVPGVGQALAVGDASHNRDSQSIAMAMLPGAARGRLEGVMKAAPEMAAGLAKNAVPAEALSNLNRDLKAVENASATHTKRLEKLDKHTGQYSDDLPDLYEFNDALGELRGQVKNAKIAQSAEARIANQPAAFRRMFAPDDTGADALVNSSGRPIDVPYPVPVANSADAASRLKKFSSWLDKYYPGEYLHLQDKLEKWTPAVKDLNAPIDRGPVRDLLDIADHVNLSAPIAKQKLHDEVLDGLFSQSPKRIKTAPLNYGDRAEASDALKQFGRTGIPDILR